MPLWYWWWRAAQLPGCPGRIQELRLDGPVLRGGKRGASQASPSLLDLGPLLWGELVRRMPVPREDNLPLISSPVSVISSILPAPSLAALSFSKCKSAEIFFSSAKRSPYWTRHKPCAHGVKSFPPAGVLAHSKRKGRSVPYVHGYRMPRGPYPLL